MTGPAGLDKTIERDSTLPTQEDLGTSLRGLGDRSQLQYELSRGRDPSYRRDPMAGYLPNDPESREAFLRRSYGDHFDQIHARLAALGQGALGLIGDPGVVQHLAELENFIAQRPYTGGLTSEKLREEFSRSLGTTRVYRGRGMTEQQFSEMMQNFSGLKPRNGPSVIDFETSDLQKILINHANPIHRETGSVQSVSCFPDNALSMGAGITDEPGKSVYLFTLEIPKLDLISFNKPPYCWSRFTTELRQEAEAMDLPPDMKEQFVEGFAYGPHKLLGIIAPNGELAYRSLEHGSEYFVYGDIPIGSTKSIHRIPDDQVPRHTPVVWNPAETVDQSKILTSVVPDWLHRPLAELPNLWPY